MMRNAIFALAATLVAAVPAFAQQSATGPGPSPTIEIALGMNGPAAPTAEFPGLTAGIALLYPIKPQFGVGVVAEADASYSRQSRTAGPRVYVRSKHATVFAQVLAGKATPTDQGIIHATGGSQLQPGAGISFGWQRLAFHFEGDYRRVNGGADTNTKTGEIRPWSGRRFLVGVTFRLWRR